MVLQQNKKAFIYQRPLKTKLKRLSAEGGIFINRSDRRLTARTSEGAVQHSPASLTTAERRLTAVSFQSLEWWFQRKWGLLGFWEMGTHACDWQKPPWGNSTTALQSSGQVSQGAPHPHCFFCSQRTETDLSGFYASARWLHSKGQAEIRHECLSWRESYCHVHTWWDITLQRVFYYSTYMT